MGIKDQSECFQMEVMREFLMSMDFIDRSLFLLELEKSWHEVWGKDICSQFETGTAQRCRNSAAHSK